MPAPTRKKPAKSATRRASSSGTPARAGSQRVPLAKQVEALVQSLKGQASDRVRVDMAVRYGIRTPLAFGVPVGRIRAIARDARKRGGGADHALAAALWEAQWYEARMLAVFIDDPALVTISQMDRWCADFDNWGICDTACFHLFDRSPLAWGRVAKWSTRKPEFERRAAFALLASLALHDKKADDGLFLAALPLVKRGASDDRNFVKKAVSWALRSIGGRGPMLHAEAAEVAARLADGPRGSPERWVGSDALRAFKSPAMARRVARKTAGRSPSR